jgi:TDG/mug DNA glycosylase family protein
VPEPIGAADDRRLPDWGYGVTNLVPRATPGIDTLAAGEYVAGLRRLRRKLRRWKPEVVALVGVTLYRAIYGAAKRQPTPAPFLGLRPERLEGAALFVLPNPSGRNANYSHAQMRAAFADLAAYLASLNS